MGAFSVRLVPREVRPYVKVALEKGWLAKVDGGNHVRLMKPGFKPITVPSSPSDHRWFQNCVAEFRRSGIEKE
jgi:hypothetical protein